LASAPIRRPIGARTTESEAANNIAGQYPDHYPAAARIRGGPCLV